MQPHSLPALVLSAIGAAILGGKFAGITTGNDGVPYALVLLADKPTAEHGADEEGDIPWVKAMAWAKNLNADLPTRPEAAMLFQLLKADFRPTWTWTNEEVSFATSYAWVCGFGNGNQIFNLKDGDYAAVAVRRFPLQSFNPSAVADAGAPVEASADALQAA